MARIYRFFLRQPGNGGMGSAENLVETLQLSEQVEPEIFFQLTKVLRVEAGQKIVLLPIEQKAPFYEYHYFVKTVAKKELILKFEQKTVNENELDFRLGLVLALPNKPDKLEFILQKAVEIGVGKIILTEGDFSQMKHALRLERLQKIVIEAAEQSERAVVPTLTIAGKLKDYLMESSKKGGSQLLVAMERAGIAQDLFKNVENNKGVDILIGPEGGFSSEEKKLIANLKLECFSLGNRILRMETAAILSLGLMSFY